MSLHPIPLVFDSLGVRSSSFKVSTNKVKVLVDPWADLGAWRFKLPPHEIEKTKLKEFRGMLEKEARNTQIVTVTHYHMDHFSYNSKIYEGKIVLAKDINKCINHNQKMRGVRFKNEMKEKTKLLIYADSKTLTFEDLTLKFSPPLPHGEEGTFLGYILMITSEKGKGKILFTSDVGGFLDDKATSYVVNEEPKIIICDGPPTYLLGNGFTFKELEKSKRNLLQVITKTNVKTLILDHHLTRELNYRMSLREVYEKGEEAGVEVMTAARYLGVDDLLLEASRKKLYEKGSSFLLNR